MQNPFSTAGPLNASGTVSIRRPGDQRERHPHVVGDGGGRHHRSVPAANRWQRLLPLRVTFKYTHTQCGGLKLMDDTHRREEQKKKDDDRQEEETDERWTQTIKFKT